MSEFAGSSILIVDDDASNLIVAERALDGEAYLIQTVDSGVRALERIGAQPPDLILLDVMMPGVDGIEVCCRVKQIASNYIPIILLTAYDEPDIRRRGLAAGADDFISKPFDSEALIVRVRNLLRIKHLYDELRAANEEMETELRGVGDLQRSMLPEAKPSLPGFGLHSLFLPARLAGGDFFDFIDLGENKLGIVVGDASGHGPPAAVLMAIARVTMRLCSNEPGGPAGRIAAASRAILPFVPVGQFITLFYGELDAERSEMSFALAGHCPPVLFGAGSDAPVVLKTATGLPLGLDGEPTYEERSIELKSGEKILLYTDGIYEAMNSDGELFGFERFIKLIQNHAEAPAEQFCDLIVDDVQRFMMGHQFRDDCVLFLIECY